MFRFTRNLPISYRLVFVFTLATIIPIIAIATLGNFYLQSMSTRSGAVATSFEAQNIATQEQINLQRMNALLQARFAQLVGQNSPSLAGDPALAASGDLANTEIADLEIDFDQNLGSYQQTYEIDTSNNMSVIRSILISDNPAQGHKIINNQKSALDSVIQTDWNLYRVSQDKLLTEIATPHFNFFIAYQDFYTANLNFLNLRIHWQQVVDASTSMGTAVTQVGPSLIDPLIMYTAAALLFTLLVIIVAALLINLSVVKPLRSLLVLTKKISDGEMQARAEIRGRDEIYQVAGSINSMMDVIARLVQETQTSHANLQTSIEKLIHEVSGIREGDLRRQASVENDQLGLLASFFNIMTEELSTLVINVKTMARGVQASTLQVFGYIEQLVDSTEVQNRQIHKTATDIESMANFHRKAAERAAVLYKKAQEAHETVLDGRTMIQRAINSIERVNDNVHTTSVQVVNLGDRSREISNIVEVITGIAQQTNRLALDATVQAAMAGENGKGFAAVAVDIRRLSEKAKEQATIINQIVTNVLEDINMSKHLMQLTEQESGAGTLLTKQIGTALESVFLVVENQASEIEVASQTARQQVQSFTTVVQTMHAVTEAEQQNNMSTREVTRQVERLAQLAGQLLISVEVFKLREISSSSSYGRRPLTPRPQEIGAQGNPFQRVNIVSNRLKPPTRPNPQITSRSQQGNSSTGLRPEQGQNQNERRS
jgi:methyl-accepting chemotaxis protein